MDQKALQSTPSHCPEDRKRQMRWPPPNARPPGVDPIADDGNSRDNLPVAHRPMDIFARRLLGCHKQRGATAPLSAISFPPSVRTPMLLRSSHKRAMIPGAACYQTWRDIPTACPVPMQGNLNETARNSDVPAAVESSRPSLPRSSS